MSASRCSVIIFEMRDTPALCCEASDQTGTRKDVEELVKEAMVLSSERDDAAKWSKKAYTNRAMMSPYRIISFSGKGGRRSRNFNRWILFSREGFFGVSASLSLGMLDIVRGFGSEAMLGVLLG